MKRNFNRILACGIACLFLYSCNQKETAVQPEQVAVSVNDQRTQLEEAARVLAVSLQDPAVRVAIKKEAEKKFDGDFDVLYRNFAGFQLPDGSTFESKLMAAKLKLDGPSAGKTIESQKLAATSIALFNISVPVHIEQWDANAYTPLVAVNAVVAGSSKIKAFDAQGKMHLLDLDQIPALPVVVVGLNERVNEDGTLKQFIDVTAVSQDVKPRNTSPSGRTQWGEYSRATDYQEKMNMFRWTNNDALGRAESWAAGAPEVRMTVKAISGNQDVWSGFWKDDRGKFNDAAWYVCETPMFFWTLPTLGRGLVYYWVEEDAGVEVTAVISGSFLGQSYSLTAKGKSEDFKIGHTAVDFYTKMPTLYSLGTFEFVTYQP